MLEKRRTYNENKVETILGPGTKLTAEIESKGTIRIEGELFGRVRSEDTIVVHDTGKVRADLVAGQVIVSGDVEGNVFAHDRIEITNKGRLIGNVSTPRLSVAEGVVFEGHCTMMKAGEAKPPELAAPIISFERAGAANLAVKAD